MRASSFVFAAVAGVAVGFLGPSGVNAMTNTSPAGVRVATEAMDNSALVHCRPYRHWHRWEHRWTHGCHGGAVGVEADVVVRRGHRVRVHEGSRTTIRSGTTTREQTTIRSGTGTSKTGESTKPSTGPGKTGETKSGTGTKPESSGRAKGGEKPSTGGSSGGTSGT
ncbi:MAG TPA: hypothetical protein VN917_10960, partial [Xanthobacteraceae bacterium]|nr:hypothetical protein [Xanthobacteraceae bacterium]